MHDRGRLGKNACSKKAYKHEVLIKISQKVRFEKNYIVWKHKAKNERCSYFNA